jgi:hypothetical protein
MTASTAFDTTCLAKEWSKWEMETKGEWLP